MKTDWIPVLITAVIGSIGVYLVIKFLGVVIDHPWWAILLALAAVLGVFFVRKNSSN